MKVLEENSKETIFNTMKNTYLSLPDEMKDSLEAFLNRYGYWGKLDAKAEIFEQIENKADCLKNHFRDLQFLYENLVDYRSKKLLLAILNNWYYYDFHALQPFMYNPFSHYFDLDILDFNEEVFVDVGAYIGDTTLDFIHTKENGYKKIYCYEITEDSFKKLKENVKPYLNVICKNKAVGEKKQTIFLKEEEDTSSNHVVQKGEKKVEMVSLDEDIFDKITLIKMDIEGYEQKALMGSSGHIQKEHPTLLISAYHNHEDLWKIPKMIKEMYQGYQFYLRFYGNQIFPTEIVLFAKAN